MDDQAAVPIGELGDPLVIFGDLEQEGQIRPYGGLACIQMYVERSIENAALLNQDREGLVKPGGSKLQAPRPAACRSPSGARH